MQKEHCGLSPRRGQRKPRKATPCFGDKELPNLPAPLPLGSLGHELHSAISAQKLLLSLSDARVNVVFISP